MTWPTALCTVSGTHIVQLWSCAWRLHAHVRVRASRACSWSFHEHKCSWELHEHAHGGFTSTMLECNGHNMGQDNMGPKLHFFLCEIFLANSQPILDNIFFEFSFFVHHHYQANKAKSAKRNSYIWGVFCFFAELNYITLKANLSSYQLVLDVNIAV